MDNKIKKSQPVLNVFLIYLIVISLYFFKLGDTVTPLTSTVILICWLVIFRLLRTSESLDSTFLKMMILAIPVSFSSVFGSVVENLYLNWFNIFSVFYLFYAILIMFKKGLQESIRDIPVFIYLSIFLWTVVFLMNNRIMKSGLSSFLINMFYFALLVVTLSIKDKLKFNVEKLSVFYNDVVVITSVFVIVQYLLKIYLNIEFGRIELFGGNRLAFGFVNFDYSFLSLFLVSSTFINIRNVYRLNKINILEVLKMLIAIIASNITTARTGLIALAITLCLYILFEVLLSSKRKINSKKKMFIAASLFVTAILSFYSVLKIRGLNGSGRIQSYILALDAFKDHIIIGNGLAYLANSTKPHNLVIQLLSQMGIFVTFITLYTYTMIMTMVYQNQNNSLFYNLIIIFIGSMFIPDILISRFITVLLILGIQNKQPKEEKLQEEKLRVAHLLSGGGYSGAEKVVIEIIKASPNWVDSYYVSPPGQIEEVLSDLNISNKPYKSNNPLEIIKSVHALSSDVVYGHDFKMSLMAALFFPSRFVISHIHQNPDWFSKFSLKSVIYLISTFFTSEIVFVSVEARDTFIFSNLIKHKSRVINNYVNEEKIIALSKERNNSLKKYDLLYLGRLEEVKDPLKMLEISKKVLMKKTIKIGIIGDGILKDEITNKIKKMGLSDSVDILGYLSNPFPFLKASKVSIVTSKWEGFGLSAVESMILGVPVVASNIGGLRSVLSQGGGTLCDTEDEFVEAIILYLNNDVFYEDASMQARLSSQRFTNIDQWEDNFQRLFLEVRKRKS